MAEEEGRQRHRQRDIVRAVEYDGLLHLSHDSDVADDPEAHLRRAWFVVKAARAIPATTATEIERLVCLARIWQCSDSMGCSYGPFVAQQLDGVIARLPDPWARGGGGGRGGGKDT